MKKIILMIVCVIGGTLSAQVNVNAKINQNDLSNAFLDASENAENFGESIGRGINFPQTDLSIFVLDANAPDGILFPNYYDGMIVYNIKKGGATTDPSLETQTQDLEPGFYYFYNPEGKNNQNITKGKWVRLGAKDVFKITDTEAISKEIGDKKVYVKKGEFTLTTTDNGVRIAFPQGMTSMYSINIFRKTGDASHLVGSSLYTYKLTERTGKNIIFGSGVVSTAYPAGTYEYVLEYFK